ncbi:hypothetical protein NKR23_g12225 [Pleurostoma richardsiae]|uniref:Uncharacterized protein n=1 Tax=Pleurostoma richardsiae TaxID=41990 RepID=A0AA38RGW9_9PEZI|nr:hypothetical protein NKR23_g12225 [Pleurostoma richardsiae]
MAAAARAASVEDTDPAPGPSTSPQGGSAQPAGAANQPSDRPPLQQQQQQQDQQQDQQQQQPLPMLPAPGEGEGDGPLDPDTTTTVEVGGAAVRLDRLGPLVVHQDGTVSRIANWQEMTDVERRNTLRVLGKRNQLRLDTLRREDGAQKSAE